MFKLDDKDNPALRTIMEKRLMIKATQTVTLPGDVVSILSVSMQDGNLRIWYETDVTPERAKGGPTVRVKVYMIANNQPTLDIVASSYVGTVEDCGYIWHVFVSGALIR